MKDLAALLRRLGRTRTPQLVCAFGVYPRRQATAALDQQGAAILQLAGALTQACPRAAAYRVLWAQAVVVVPLASVPDARSRLARPLAASRFEAIEHRALLVATSGIESVCVLDGLLEALASRRNFGSARALPAVRLIDGVVER